jgi:hypothetical protein
MREYFKIGGFENVYLEDSYVLRFQESARRLDIEVEAVLREEHQLYQAPKPGEQYCYRKAVIRFSDADSITWVRRDFSASVDSDGKVDLGNIDYFCEDDGVYKLGGDWGEVHIRSREPSIMLLG